MIVNLIENSIQHTPAGTAISVELGRDQLGVYATIADTGPGVPEWAREKIFRRFFRLDESRGSRGNGLGLSLVAAIAKHHGVTLTLSDNSPGLRTVLRFPESVGAGAPMVPSRSPGLDLQPRRAG
jgi:signal transduction histidine kinase